ncbi:hypothetical protein X739_00690 [Mesorhizobium sp. LNHC220B00]|nr:hypothetical protein [Mesorhizobium sp. LNHC220B00]ESY89045.1 hypothetical protein X739_00690 [Mesorhizobium sp. LNHC220B00]
MSTAARALELLSYLTGLGPVGQPVPLRRVEVMSDLRLDHNTYNVCLNHLISGRFVRRVTTRTLTVLRRPEEFK